ncbi:MAG: beta-propeller fold lactonase family protein [Pseudomonadota bacterium]
MNKIHRRSCMLVPMLVAMSATAWASDTGYLFVSSEKDNSISVLDGETYDVVKVIGTAARPRHLQFDPNRELIYVAAGDGNAIDVIDVAKLELVDRITGIDDPELFDLSSDGKTMYISLEDDAKLGILDLEAYFAERDEKPELTVAAPTEGELADEDDDEGEEEDEDEEDEAEDGDEGVPGMVTIEVGEEPEGILVNPNGQTVYVSSEVANLVHVVDVDAAEIVANVVVGNRPRRFALTPDQKELWVSNELSGSVSILDVATNEVLETIEFLPPGFRPEQVTPVGITMTDDGQTAIVGLGRANHVAFVDTASREIEDYVLVGERAWNTTLNRDNSLLFVVNGLSDDVSIIDVGSRKVQTSIPVGRVPHTVLIDD